MKWVPERSKPYKLELKYSFDHDTWREVEDTLRDAKRWAADNGMKIWEDGLFYVRFTNERDLAWFLLRWS